MDNGLKNRLKRLEGQLKKLSENIESKKDCSDVIPQFLAVKGALAAAYEEYVCLSLEACAATDQKKIKKLISQLIKA